MDTFVVLKKLLIIKKAFPEAFEDFMEDFEDMEKLYDFVYAYGKYVDLVPNKTNFESYNRDEVYRIYDIIKYNKQGLIDGTITKDNFVNPEERDFGVDWSQSYTEYGTEYGSASVKASDKETAKKIVNYQVDTGNFDTDWSDTEMQNRTTDDFDFEIREGLDKTIHKVLKEQYKLFINKNKKWDKD